LLDLLISDKLDGAYTTVTTWVNTAFDGHPVFPQDFIDRLHLETLAETEATLADGCTVSLETFVCFIDWLGRRRPLQVISNIGRFPLLDTGLLEERVLHIDYGKRELGLD
jgi:predicted aspartyl protease